MPYLRSVLRKLIPPLAMVMTAFAAFGGGAPPEAAAFVGSSVGLLATQFVPSKRPRESVVNDDANRLNRARVYEQFGGSVAVAWRSAGILMTFQPQFKGKVHGLLMLMREQRRFGNETAALAATLSSVLLYASTETQQLAIDLFKTFGEQLLEVGKHAQGSSEARKSIDVGSIEIGNRAVAWRVGAQADLATSGRIDD